MSKFQTATLAATAALTAGTLFASARAKPARGHYAHAGSTTVHVVEHAITDDGIPPAGART